jgi:hypothetical protein
MNMKGVIKMKRKFSLIFLCVLLAFAAQANALLITPDSGSLVFPVTKWVGDDTANLNAGDISDIVGETVQELYKQNTGNPLPPDTGPLAGSYQTTFTPTSDPEDALIDVSGPYIYSSAYLFVKDGNSSPAWYLFDLFGIGWNGTDDIKLEDFWAGEGTAGKGSISHVALYGGDPVPEPISMILFGTGLVGVGGYVRRKFKK